jgi:hypothetical protein
MLVTKENTDQKEFVKIDKFGWVVSWFGSIYTNFVDNMINLSDKSWFHGDISGRMAEYQLKNKPVGTFLVRLSVASYGSFTLSYVTHTTINHYRCTYSIQTNTFEAGGIEYNSLSSLINSKSQIFELTEPCLGSKYAMLDQEDNFGYPIFSDHIIVDWNNFLHHLLNDLNLYPKSDVSQLTTGKIQDTQLLRKIKCLRLMLVTKENTDQKEIVKIDKFGWVVSWFGSYTNFLDNMINLSDKAWFHGDISGRMAEYQLKNKPLGTFLVRLSVASYGSYTLSYGQLFYYSIHHSDELIMI